MTNRVYVCSGRVKNQRPLKLAIDSMERQHPVATSVLYEPTTYVYAEMPHCSLTRLNDSANATLLLYKDILLLFLSFFFQLWMANHAGLDYQSMQSPPFRPYFLASNLAASRSRHRGHKVLLAHPSLVAPPRPRH